MGVVRVAWNFWPTTYPLVDWTNRAAQRSEYLRSALFCEHRFWRFLLCCRTCDHGPPAIYEIRGTATDALSPLDLRTSICDFRRFARGTRPESEIVALAHRLHSLVCRDVLCTAATVSCDPTHRIARKKSTQSMGGGICLDPGQHACKCLFRAGPQSHPFAGRRPARGSGYR